MRLDLYLGETPRFLYESAESAQGLLSVTVINTYSDCTDCLPPLYYRLESCGDSEPIILYTSQNLSAYVGQTITLDGYDGCYNVTIFSSNVPSTVTVVFKNNYPNCIECAAPRYKLTDCDGVRPSIYTTTNLSAYLSSILKLTFYPDTCWTVSVAQEPINPGDIYVDQTFVDCPECFKALFTCSCKKITLGKIDEFFFFDE